MLDKRMQVHSHMDALATAYAIRTTHAHVRECAHADAHTDKHTHECRHECMHNSREQARQRWPCAMKTHAHEGVLRSKPSLLAGSRPPCQLQNTRTHTHHHLVALGPTSSIKMIEGLLSRAMENSCATSFSLSPSHLLTRSLLLTEKNVLSASVATACGQR